jgi:hypothetical protein
MAFPALRQRGPTWKLAYDEEIGALRFELPSGMVKTNVFNCDGQRVQFQSSVGTSNIVWHGKAYLLQTGADNVTTVVYTQEPTQFRGLISQGRDA